MLTSNLVCNHDSLNIFNSIDSWNGVGGYTPTQIDIFEKSHLDKMWTSLKKLYWDISKLVPTFEPPPWEKSDFLRYSKISWRIGLLWVWECSVEAEWEAEQFHFNLERLPHHGVNWFRDYNYLGFIWAIGIDKTF